MDEFTFMFVYAKTVLEFPSVSNEVILLKVPYIANAAVVSMASKCLAGSIVSRQ